MTPAGHLERRLSRLPRLGLARLPTPLEPLPRLSAHLGGPELWIKREDATGLGLTGGNKLRKLDVLLAEALATGADVLVSGGVVQSNSQRQVAAAAARRGLDCHLVVFQGRTPTMGRESALGGNALLNRVFGAVLHETPWDGDRASALQALAERLKSEGRRPYVVPYGASNALGAAAYATAALEIAGQMEAAPTAVLHASGSGGTQAGLVVGAMACLPGTRIVGVDIDAEAERVRADVAALAHGAGALLEVEVDEGRIEVVAGHAGPAYGVPHAATLDAIALAGRLEGLVLDPVYSGKALAGLIALIRARRWRRGDRVVFLHTGGEPALFAYREGLGGLSGEPAAMVPPP